MRRWLSAAALALLGAVAAAQSDIAYTAKFKELSFDGQNLQARYEFPLDTQADVALTGTFTGGAAQGTWSLVPKGGDQVFAGGGWKVTKK